MTNWKNHILFGIFLSLVFAFITNKYFEWNLWLITFSVPIIFLYSILPDIDHENSKITWFMITLSTIIIVIGCLPLKIEFFKFIPQNILFLGVTLLVLTLIAVSTPHRGIFHTLYAVFLTPLLLVFVFGFNRQICPLYIISIIAYWSHLFLDGIPFKIKL